MMLAERMRDMHDPWVTEYRGQFNYAIPQHQEVQSLIYDYDNNYHSRPHPSSRMPNGALSREDMPPHPAGFYNDNGQFHDASGRPSDPPPPPPLPRKRIGPKKKVTDTNTRKLDVKAKGSLAARNKTTVSEAPHFQSTKAANRHKACVDNTDVFVKNTAKDAPLGSKKGTKKTLESNQNKRLYHPLNYDRSGTKGALTTHEVDPSPRAPPMPFAAPVQPTYSPFSTQTLHPHPHPHTSVTAAPHVRQVTPSPRGPSSPPHPLPPSLPPTPPPPPPPPRPAFQVRQVEMSPHESSAIPVPPPPPPPSTPPVSHVVKRPSFAAHDEVRTIVPPPAFSREPTDRSTIPAHTCSHQWRSDSDLYWSDIPQRRAPPLECAMCFASPHPNEYTKSFDPSRWLELNPKFYKYMPAQSLRKIPAAGKAVPRSASFSVANMYA